MTVGHVISIFEIRVGYHYDYAHICNNSASNQNEFCITGSTAITLISKKWK